jgi:hypothetical protein
MSFPLWIINAYLHKHKKWIKIIHYSIIAARTKIRMKRIKDFKLLGVKVFRVTKMKKWCVKVLNPPLFAEYAMQIKKMTRKRILLLVPANAQGQWALCMLTALECGLIPKEKPDLLILLIPTSGLLSGVRCVTLLFLCITSLILIRVLNFSTMKIHLLIVITRILSLKQSINRKKWKLSILFQTRKLVQLL